MKATDPIQTPSLVQAAEAAARAAGDLMRANLRLTKEVALETQHDIKLELDSRCQRLITRALRHAFPRAAVLGEEGTVGRVDSPWRWVVDPIDGTVNFTYGIPHACVSIALQEQVEPGVSPVEPAYPDGYVTRGAVVYDPFTNELWSATDTGPALLNGAPIAVSARNRLSEAIIALGFAKSRRSLNHMMPVFQRMVHRVRKVRIMGAAALSMTYVATGRFDGYVESGVRLWDIAAGGLILQRAGGVFWRRAIGRDQTYELVISGPGLQATLHRLNDDSRSQP